MSSEVSLHEIALPDGTRCDVLWRRCAGASYCCGSGRLRFFFVNGNVRFFRGMMKRIEALSFPPERIGSWRVKSLSPIAEKTFRIGLEHPTEGEKSVICAVRADARRRSIGAQADRTLRRIAVTLPGEYCEALVPYALRLVDWSTLLVSDPRLFSCGEDVARQRTLRWRGREYPVRLGARSSHVEDGVLHLRAAPDALEAEVEEAYGRFLRKDFEAYVGPIHERAVEETNLRPSEWGMIRRGVHTLGRCTLPARRVTYHWRIVAESEAFVRSIVIHELCHLREMNHGPRFWRLVLSFCPEYFTLHPRRRMPNLG